MVGYRNLDRYDTKQGKQMSERAMLRHALAGKAAEGVDNLQSTLLWRGIIAMLFGVAALFWPGTSLSTLVYLVSGYLLLDGLATIVMTYRAGTLGVQLIHIVASIVAGIAILAWPEATGRVVLIVLGLWALSQGVGLLLTGRDLKQQGDEASLMIYGGVFLVVVGIGALFFQGVVKTAIAWVIGLFAILIGGLLVYVATRLRSLATRLTNTL